MTSHEVVEWYMRERGVLSPFRSYLYSQRYGQAFFNALPREDRDRLVGTVWDPFHRDSPFDCYLAIEHVLTR